MKKTLTLEDENFGRALSGDVDRNLKMIEQLTGVAVGVRGDRVFFDGPENKVEEVAHLVADIVENLSAGRPVTYEEMETVTGLSSSTLNRELRFAKAWLHSALKS